VNAGFDTVEHALWIDRGQRVDVDEEVVGRMAEEGIAVCPTLATGFPRAGARPHWVAAVGPLEERLAVVHHMFERGVPIIAGTDDGRYAEFVYELELLHRCGMTTVQVLEAATSLSARHLGLDDGTGAVRAGAPADLIAVEGDPLTDLSALWRVDAVFVSGRRTK
jgi:imidazolonepropionase-like amidohydrolase